MLSGCGTMLAIEKPITITDSTISHQVLMTMNMRSNYSNWLYPELPIS